MTAPSSISRRGFLALAMLAWPASVLARMRPDHPTPRPGIDASRVPAAAELHGDGDDIEVFDQVRRIPHIVDGIRCTCGCAGREGHYSLLSCFEKPGMAQHCFRCKQQGRYAYRLHEAGRSLDEIRAAMDERFR